nr:amblin-like isoform X1 [Dermacentor andersoni]
MALLSSSVILLVTVTYIHAAPGGPPSKQPPKLPPPICMKPPVLGLCQPLNQSWYFEPRHNRCNMFSMGACGGGPNRFPSEKKCMTTCAQSKGKVPPMCLQKPLTGDCEAKRHAWYFDHRKRECKMFTHGTCDSGSNYFASERKCKEVCLQVKNPVLVCSDKPRSGYCFGLNTYWYFDQNKNNCYHFKGWWCAKNANGFISYKVCMDRCSYTRIPRNCPQCKEKPEPQPDQKKQPAKGRK